jgi:hypothetical protein
MNTTAKLRIAAISIIMVIAFYISYFDLSDVARSIDLKGMGREYLFPFIIDGTIMASTFTLLAKTGLNKMARMYANAARWSGFIATVSGNAAHSGFTSVPSFLGNVAVAVFLILTIETLVHTAAGTPASRKAAAAAVEPVALTPAQKGALTKAANKAKAQEASQANVTQLRKRTSK